MNKRDFFKLSALTTGGFMLGSWANAAEDSATETDFKPNAFITITSAGVITLVAHKPEIGQGTKTSMPMLIAEDLEVPWQEVQVQSKVANEQLYGKQGAGGSQSVASSYDRLRRLGAAAKQMLVAAAAEHWGVDISECQAENATVKHSNSDKVMSYGELADKAAKQTVPDPKTVTLKKPSDFKILGKRIAGVDNQQIVTGQPLFGIDQVPEGLVYASYLRCPVFGGEAESANLEEVKQMSGVSDAFILKGAGQPMGLNGGVAVIAESTWQAMKAMKALKVQWNTGKHGNESSENLAKQAETALNKPKSKKKAQEVDDTQIEATYHYPFLAHNTMEPMNCSAVFSNGTLEMWAPTQSPFRIKKTVTTALKIPAKKQVIHITRSGGGFGRRINCDYAVECAAIAKKLEGKPVKLTWTREQDIQHDFYRNPSWINLKGSVKNNNIDQWHVHAVTIGTNNTKNPGIAAQYRKTNFPAGFVAKDSLKQTLISSNTPLGYWRAPGSNGHAFAIQSFIDELAHNASQDPLELQLKLLEKNKKVGKIQPQRMRGVLEAAAKKAGWGKQLPKGSAQGIAQYFSHNGYVAVVAEVSVSQDGVLSVDKLTAAADVGPIVNLSGAEAQVTGSMLDGLSSAWYQEIKIKDGAIVNSNFHDYPAIRMPQIGQTEVVFIESDNPPTGLGEPALPPTIPAICNAIFAATGKRIRTLPMNQHDLSWT